MPNFFVPLVQQGQQGQRPGGRRGAGPVQQNQQPVPLMQQQVGSSATFSMFLSFCFWTKFSFYTLFYAPHFSDGKMIVTCSCFRCFQGGDESTATLLAAICLMFQCQVLLEACFQFHMTWVACHFEMLQLVSQCPFQLWLQLLQMQHLISKEQYAVYIPLFALY